MAKTPHGSGKKKKSVTQTSKKCRYSPSKVANAIRAVKDGMKMRTASRLFGVPRTTLWNKVNNKTPAGACHRGPVSLLPYELEVSVKDHVLDLIRRGFPLDQESLLDSVKKLVDTLQLQVPFKNNRPGRKWFEGFLRRFPEVSSKHAEQSRLARSMTSEHSIRQWFEDIMTEFLRDGVDLTLFEDPSRVWNTGEMAVNLSPEGGVSLDLRGETAGSGASNSGRQRKITIQFTVNGSSDMSPPLAVFPSDRMPAEDSRNVPAGWALYRTESGRLSGDSFCEYMGNVFVPYLQKRNIRRPVVIFMDGRKSHPTKDASELCRRERIVLIALLQSAGSALLPLDIALFNPLKKSWASTTNKWTTNNNGEEVNSTTFCRFLNDVVVEEAVENEVKLAFCTTGLYPFTPYGVDYLRSVKRNYDVRNHATVDVPVCPKKQVSHLDYLEGNIDPLLLEEFRRQHGHIWNGDVKASFLYDLWQRVFADNIVVKTETDTPVSTPEYLALCYDQPSITGTKDNPNNCTENGETSTLP